MTGSHIRGVPPDSSPVRVITRDEILRSGAATVDQLVRQLPENFAQVDADTSLSVASTRNVSRGTSIDLHGLGAGSTLILLNGHRLAPSGEDGSFIDVSLIPLSAVDRVEILSEGASAIYGADAVGGVVNFILKRDFDGAETSVRYGGATDGGLGEFVGSQMLGKSWATGNALLIYEFGDQEGLSSNQRDFIPPQDVPIQLVPEQRRQSVMLTARQSVGERWELFGDALYSHREFEQDNVLLGETEHITGDTEQQGAVLGASRKFGETWRGEVVGNYARQKEGYTAIFQGEVNIPRSETQSSLGSLILQADGALFSIPGGNVRASVGAGARREEFDDLRTSGPTRVGSGLQRDVNSAFVEAFVPLVTARNARPAVKRLELSLAARYDDYDDVGSSSNPKAGLLWSPIEGVALRGTYATSYRVAPLAQLSDAGRTYLLRPFNDPNAADGVTNTLLLIAAGNSGLAPEESESFTLGMDFEPAWLPGLEVSATYFDIDYQDRIALPPVVGSILSLYQQTQTLAPFLDFSPDLAAIQAEIANGALFTDFFGTGLQNAEALFDRRRQNMATSLVSGIQLSARHSLSTSVGQFTPFVGGEYLLKHQFRAVSTTPAVDFVNRIFRPMDLRLRGGVNWARGDLGVSVSVNHADGYRNDLMSPAGTVSSWTTADLFVSYRLDWSNEMRRRGATIGLSVVNLADQEPPQVPPTGQLFYNFGYDVINANARGRVVSLQLSAAW
ncbi:MAG: TonB-dependent receptor [Gammaproteobacteria bacterium]|nr:TonB-dependent receptor [Gammaproteobacteria bacterium]